MNEELVAGLTEGKREVVDSIYKKYLDTVIRWTINNNGSRSDALDIFQEALVQILISARKGKLRLRSSFGAYLIATCKYTWLGRLRKERRLEIVRIEDYDTPTNDESLQMDAQLQENWLNTFLERNKMKLSDTCIRLLTLFTQGKAPAAIATELEMPKTNTVYRRKFACLKKWREHIEADPLYHQWKELQNGY